MTDLHQRALRALIALQEAVLEHCDEELTGTEAIKAIDTCNREWQKILKELRREQ